MVMHIDLAEPVMFRPTCLVHEPLLLYQQVIQKPAWLSNLNRFLSHDIHFRLIALLPVVDAAD